MRPLYLLRLLNALESVLPVQLLHCTITDYLEEIPIYVPAHFYLSLTGGCRFLWRAYHRKSNALFTRARDVHARVACVRASVRASGVAMSDRDGET
eukprot:3882870-Pleurochrysis_carterae.AAC.3